MPPPLHNPLTTLAGLAANNQLVSVVDKARLAAFAAAGLRDLLLRPRGLDQRSVRQYARAHGLPDRVVEQAQAKVCHAPARLGRCGTGGQRCSAPGHGRPDPPLRR